MFVEYSLKVWLRPDATTGIRARRQDAESMCDEQLLSMFDQYGVLIIGKLVC